MIQAGIFRILSLVGLLIVGACAQYTAPPAEIAPRIIDQAVDTLAVFRANPDLKIIDEYIPDAAGILIFPHVVKGGFLGAVEAGTGVLLARTSKGWSYPAFYVLGAGSVGLQIGLQDSSLVMILRNTDALAAIINDQSKFGADVGLMVGYQGIGYEGSTTTNLEWDILAVVGPGLGVFGGVSLEGAAIVRRNDLNNAYYGAGALPEGILLDGQYANPGADPLRRRIDL